MASVAAIYTVERLVRTAEEILPLPEERREKPTRPQPEHKRVWASLDNSPEAVITAMFDEVEHRDPKGKNAGLHSSTAIALRSILSTSLPMSGSWI
jgi:hypothetical protein